ncbi:MAG: PIN domain-containing protein [Bryobacteraceae bacterium]
MVLVDTSVWIRSLANRTPYRSELDKLLDLDEVVGHELVYGELLIGDRGGRRKLLAAYERMHQASSVPHREAVAFVLHRDLHGRGVGWIDIHLLASAIVGRLQLWTADTHFAGVAQEMGVAYNAVHSA